MRKNLNGNVRRFVFIEIATQTPRRRRLYLSTSDDNIFPYQIDAQDYHDDDDDDSHVTMVMITMPRGLRLRLRLSTPTIAIIAQV